MDQAKTAPVIRQFSTREYWLLPGSMFDGGCPKVVRPDAPCKIWKSARVETALFRLLVAVGGGLRLPWSGLPGRVHPLNKWPVNVSSTTPGPFPSSWWVWSLRSLCHPGADLVPCLAVPVDVGAVPVRSVHLPVLDLHHRHGVPVGGAAVLRLAVSLFGRWEIHSTNCWRLV